MLKAVLSSLRAVQPPVPGGRDFRAMCDRIGRSLEVLLAGLAWLRLALWMAYSDLLIPSFLVCSEDAP